MLIKRPRNAQQFVHTVVYHAIFRPNMLEVTFGVTELTVGLISSKYSKNNMIVM